MAKCLGWCGLCYANARGRENHKGHRGYTTPRRPAVEDWRVFIKRASGTGKPGPGHGAVDDPELLASRPGLFEFCSLVAWEDGKPRKPGSVLIFTDDGRWKACLTDKDAGRVAFVSADTFLELLDVINEGIVDDSLEWRKQKPWAQRGR